jgi:DNA-binding CsgD family transcriptional regulator
VTFRHALVQEAVEGELLPGERVRLHSRLAAALLAHPEWAVGVGAAVSAEIAWHWYAARDWKRALPAAVKAGVHAERVYAFPEALRQFQRVLELWARVPGAERLAGMDQLTVLERAAGAAHYADQLPLAAALVRRALGQVDPVADPVRAGLLHERLGNLLYLVGDAGALAECEAAVRLIPAWPPSAERAKVLAAQGWLLCRLFRLGAAAGLARAALDVAREAGAGQEEADALGLLGSALGFQGKATAGLPYLAAVRRSVKDAGDVDRFRYSWLFAMDLLCDLGRFEEARTLAMEGIGLFQRYGYSRMYSDLLETGLAEIDFWVGRWDQAARRNRALLERTAPGSFKRGLFTSIQVRIDAARGDLAAVGQHLESLPTALPGPEGVRQECFRAEARARLALLERRPAEAITAARDGLAALHGADKPAERLELLALGLRAAGDLAGRGRRGGSAAEVELLQDADEAFGTELRDVLAAMGTLAPEDALVSRAMARQCQAEHARLHGRADAACWARVAAGWDALGQPYPAAYARLRQAEALLAVTGSRAQAREVLNQAATAARQLGAAPLLREIELLARRSRLRLDDPAGAPERRAGTYERFGLTPRERQVLALLVEGCGNREIANRLFVTEKTASFHVSNILAKLGVASRAQAATAAHRLDLADAAGVEPDGQQGDGGSARSPSRER